MLNNGWPPGWIPERDPGTWADHPIVKWPKPEVPEQAELRRRLDEFWKNVPDVTLPDVYLAEIETAAAEQFDREHPGLLPPAID